MVATVSRHAPTWTKTREYYWMLVSILGLGAAIRAVFLAKGDFPLHDGGLFFTMIHDLQANGYRLPTFSSYNDGVIPFAYPPFTLYVAALLNDLAGIDSITILRLVPYLVSLGSIVAFARLARTMLPTRTAALLATLAFACMPSSFMWTIMGGGLTRSFGQLFALLLVDRLYVLYRTRDGRHIPWAVALAALLCLTHPEWAYFGAYTAPFLLVARGRHRDGLTASLIVGALTVVLTAPWWITVVSHHGLSPFTASVQGSVREWPVYRGIIQLALLRWTAEPFFPVSTALALVGAGISSKRRQWLVPAWLLLIGVVESRGTYHRLVIPVALLAGIGLEAILGYLGAAVNLDEEQQRADRGRIGWLARAGSVFLIGYAAFSAVVWPHQLVTPLSPGERQAMAWIAAHTPEDARFLVITGDEWGVDRSQEWFPALAKRVSVTTTQGYEWLPGAFTARARANDLARGCVWQTSECVMAWTRETGIAIDYLYVARRPPAELWPTGPVREDCCAVLRGFLDQDPRFAVVYANDDAVVYRLASAPQR